MVRRLRKNTVIAPFNLPNIAELINAGEITIRVPCPVGCVATACNEDSTLAMLVRRKGETLLTRLDQAIAKAYNEDIFTDEINPPVGRGCADSYSPTFCALLTSAYSGIPPRRKKYRLVKPFSTLSLIAKPAELAYPAQKLSPEPESPLS
jgi:hypothetical protein